jgi:hypothetical protein
MHINYIVVAHERPFQLRRLINRLASSNVHFYVHIDKKVDIRPFVEALDNINSVHMINEADREVCRWGGVGIVMATLACMRYMIRDQRNGRCVLLSVQDYPIVSNHKIKGFFESNKTKDFIDSCPFPISDWIDGGYYRLNQYHYQLGNKKYSTRSLPSIWDPAFYAKLMNHLVLLLKLLARGKIPYQIFSRRDHSIVKAPCGGHGWWALNVSTIKAIISFLDQNPNFLSFFKHVHVPDEIIFQSILKQIVTESEVHPTVTYTNWLAGGSSPKVFAEQDLDELKTVSGEFLFARKFSEEDDSKILDLLDEYLLVCEDVDT